MTDIPDYTAHPFTEIFARIPHTEEEYKALEQSLLTLGMINPIVLYRNQILAGLTRYAIAKERNGISGEEIGNVQFTEFNGNDEQALQLVIDENNARRQLTDTERAMAAARMVLHHPKHNSKEKNQQWAMEMFRLRSPVTVSRALGLFAKPRPDLIEAVDNRTLYLTNAFRLIETPAATVQKILASDNPNVAAVKIVKQSTRQNNQIAMANGAIAETNKTPDRSMRFGIIYADPPWKFETYSEAGKGKSAENHYPVMELEDIKNIDIPSAKDCALFLWTTISHLENAIDVLNAWGFEYKSAYGWHKTKIGTGYWSRNNLELLLLGTKGTVPAPLPEMLSDQCMTAAQGKHSEKPEIFADMITRFFPNVPKAELFARRNDHKGENWYYFGNEVGVQIEVESKPKRNGNGKRKKKEEAQAVSSDGEQEGFDPAAEQQREMDTEDTIARAD